MAELPVVTDPYQAQADIAARKLKKKKEESLTQTAETYGARGRFYSGILAKQEGKIGETYATEEKDLYTQAAISRAAEEKADQRIKEARQYQTSERVGSQDWQTTQAIDQRAWQSAEAAMGREFTTGERQASQDWSQLQAVDQRDWASAEAKLGRTFTTEERTAIQNFQEAQAKITNDMAQAQQDWLMSDDYWNKQAQLARAGKAGSGNEYTVGLGGGTSVSGGAGTAIGAGIGNAILPGIGGVVGGWIGSLFG